ncbi:hypothetical protein V1520DRAFT_394042 [Lipomyces starkeyi]
MQCIKGIASSIDADEQTKQLEELQNDYPTEAVSYFLQQWWVDGQYERWAEISIRKHVNFGNSTTSRVEGSHGAFKVALTSSSGTLLTAGNKINRHGTDQSQHRSIIGSNKNLHVRLEIRNQVETANLCTTISREALELVYAEVNKLHHNAEDGTRDDCSCAAWNRYLLPCRHRIQLGLPLDVTDIHPRWRVNPVLPPLSVALHNIDPDTLSSVLKDPSIALPRKGRPRGTRRLQTSAENPGHNRRSRTCPKFLSQQSLQGIEGEDASAAEDDKDAEDFHDDERDAAFELMWVDVPSLT